MHTENVCTPRECSPRLTFVRFLRFSAKEKVLGAAWKKTSQWMGKLCFLTVSANEESSERKGHSVPYCYNCQKYWTRVADLSKQRDETDRFKPEGVLIN